MIVEDIGTDNAFDKAVEGVQGVAHTASPFHFNAGGEKGDPDEILIKPAVNGTTNILKAAKSHGKDVKRVVITSSFAAVVNNRQAGHKFTEDEWNQDSLDQYEKEGKDAPGNCLCRRRENPLSAQAPTACRRRWPRRRRGSSRRTRSLRSTWRRSTRVRRQPRHPG